MTKSIFETLAPFCINQSISIQEREIAPAGPVAHLKNRIHADLESGVSTENVLRALHPTPAISGFPKQEALDFIQKHEQHNRDLYGGYWGIQNETMETYFVHIRCMQVFSDKIALYAGGGITAGSVIDEEWEEAEQKMNTLLSLL
ncbi:MAG: chorismate-binding protein [Bacteroidetes bacterium]|nr:chorismate-binding protein [Bacteroidota bacterium]